MTDGPHGALGGVIFCRSPKGIETQSVRRSNLILSQGRNIGSAILISGELNHRRRRRRRIVGTATTTGSETQHLGVVSNLEGTIGIHAWSKQKGVVFGGKVLVAVVRSGDCWGNIVVVAAAAAALMTITIVGCSCVHCNGIGSVFGNGGHDAFNMLDLITLANAVVFVFASRRDRTRNARHAARGA